MPMLEDEVPSKTYAASGAALSPPEKMETATRTLRHVAVPLLSGMLEPTLVNLEKVATVQVAVFSFLTSFTWQGMCRKPGSSCYSGPGAESNPS